MPFIITDPCIETKDTACVDVCPVDCIHPRKDEAEFAAATMLYIHPEECIDCGACVPACPVAAIYESIDATPSHQKDLIEANADLPQRRCRRDGEGGRDRQGARRGARRTSWPFPARNVRPRTRALSERSRSTWNVNGIRARHAQVQEWIERDRPDVVCLQELKATSDQMPAALFEMEGYWCYWHGGKGYSGVGLHVSKTLAPERPTFSHPEFDFENRIVTADVGRRDGRVDLRPERRQGLSRQDAVSRSAHRVRQGPHGESRTMVLCGDLNVARTERDVHPKERKPRAIGQLPEEREAARADDRPRSGRRRPRARSRQRRSVHVVGAVAQYARTKYRLAARLRPGQHATRGARCLMHCSKGHRDE